MVKDALGKILHEGDMVHVSVGDPPTWLTGKVKSISMGGSVVGVAQGKQVMSAGRVVLELMAQSNFNPTEPVCLDILKLEQEEKTNGGATVSETPVDNPR